MKDDITLNASNGYFNYRVGAIILNENQLLMVKNDKFPYYYSVGGRVRFGEISNDALLRETYEETNIIFDIDRLVFIHENFFVSDSTDNRPFHEISLFFLMKPNKDLRNISCNSAFSGGVKEHLHWLPVDELAEYPLYPEFFKTDLKSLPNNVKHYITKNDKTYCL